MSSHKQATSKDYTRLTFVLIPSDEFANRIDDSYDREGGLTKWLAGRAPKQTIIVGDDDERHLDAMANPESGCYDQCLIFAAREAFLLAQKCECVNQRKCSIQVASTFL